MPDPEPAADGQEFDPAGWGPLARNKPYMNRAGVAGCPAQIEVVTRDRAGAYALAAARALPGAMQVADRTGAYALAAGRALPGAKQVADRWHI